MDFRVTALVGLALLTATLAAVFTSEEAKPVVAPLATLAVIALLYFAVMIRRDRRLPVVELGSVFVLVIVVYGSMPLVNFIAGGLEWGRYSDSRLQGYASTPREVGGFAWNSVALLASFTATYSIVRGRPKALIQPLQRPRPSTTAAIVILSVLLLGYFTVLDLVFGVSYDQGYEQLVSGVAPTTSSLPLIVQQVSHNLRAMLFIEKQLLLLIFIGGWHSLRNRLYAIGLLSVQLLTLLSTFGARTETVMLLLTAFVAYDRFVRPLSIKVALIGGTCCLAAVITYGVARESHLAAAPFEWSEIASRTNEFQAVWSTAYDLKQKRESGLLEEVPWQVYASDLYRWIPSQLLPFEKIDPSHWYLSLLGNQTSGFMFGMMSEGSVGFGIYDIMLRGAALAIVFGLIHRWYARRQSSFWATAAYVFLLGWSYYSFRATTFYWSYFFIYRFGPAVLGTLFVSQLLTVWDRRSRDARFIKR